MHVDMIRCAVAFFPFSRNWRKQKRKTQRLHADIANIRKDALHKVTTTFSKNRAIREQGWYEMRLRLCISA
ncbi:transposase [Xenorhabdus nematophila]|uniref:Transposase n=1 Tax=Xenorhabdus nematophila (strain ATCC 19061 / DSM 3370 / CCUG 14189 / LMG 1036 / NCIMB 9965 / AN6) TaxID=406817 RepID=D3VK24_XENNA